MEGVEGCELIVVHSLLSLVGKNLRWNADNTNVVRIIHKVSMVEELQFLAMAISIEAQWVPRALDIKANDISRYTDFDDRATSSDIWIYGH